MMKPNFKYIFGPVPSWRLGSSLGIDLLSQEEKACNFDCVYCQLGPTKRYSLERKIYIPVWKIIDELSALPEARVDYITFSGRGEPTLAANLRDAIKAVKLLRKEPIAVLTNAALLSDALVRKDLLSADFVVAKLDAYSPESLLAINRPAPGIDYDSILEGIKKFKKEFHGRLALQMMFTEVNKIGADQLAALANMIKPDEIQLNTPLRHSAVKPLSSDEVLSIKELFLREAKGMNIVSVYDCRPPRAVTSLSAQDTLRRRGKIE